MFKIGSFEQELMEEMSKHLVANQAEKTYSFNKLAKAADYLNNAADLFDDVGMNKQSEQVTRILEKLASEDIGSPSEGWVDNPPAPVTSISAIKELIDDEDEYGERHSPSFLETKEKIQKGIFTKNELRALYVLLCSKMRSKNIDIEELRTLSPERNLAPEVTPEASLEVMEDIGDARDGGKKKL